jgi:amino acid transporter
LLGISGFESSANFIEEQDKGVFPKTLRNMWVAVAVFNPLISLLTLAVMPLTTLIAHKNDLLAHMGGVVAGKWLQTIVSVDAFLVLSGAVLTSYVGVTGLLRRMALDRVMPQFLLKENRLRRTNHYIILGFFVLCVSILFQTKGDVDALAGVYTMSFLCVMALFAIGNMLLKIKRGRLPREVKASWLTVIIALIGVSIGLAGQVSWILRPKDRLVFLIYVMVAGAGVFFMLTRLTILKIIFFVSRSLSERVQQMTEWINSLTVVYFTRGDNLATLNRAAQYVLANEQTRRLMVVHVYQDGIEIPDGLADHLKTLDRVYPQLRIDFVAVKGTFGPECIEALSKRLDVPKNYMFIGTPGDRFPHNIADLGGVRLVM